MLLAACAKDVTPLAPPAVGRREAAGPPQLEPATTAGSSGPLVYRGVLAGAVAEHAPPTDVRRGKPYARPEEELLLASALTPFLQFEVSGYYKSCFDRAIVERRSGESWSGVRPGPERGEYYLNGKPIGHTQCDVVGCYPIEHPLRVPLVRLESGGALPSSTENWPSYQAEPLRGEVRVRYPYFQDASCTSAAEVEHRVRLD